MAPSIDPGGIAVVERSDTTGPRIHERTPIPEGSQQKRGSNGLLFHTFLVQEHRQLVTLCWHPSGMRDSRHRLLRLQTLAVAVDW